MKKILLPLLLISGKMLGQETDIRSWTGVSLEKKLNKHISLNANLQVRTTDNFTAVGSYVGEFGLGYKINKHWEVSAYYRFSKRQKWDKSEDAYIYKPFHRFYANIDYDRKISIFKLSYRLRYQDQFKDTDTGLEETKSYLRNKIELAYPNKTRFTPSISADFFYKIGEDFDQIRYKAGVDYIVNKRNSVGLTFFRDYALVPTDLDVYTIGLTYKLKL
ncbi:DUF2490 domain-containing protein [Flectobacillus longus]|uniref:DUF2490 domain-containing protein n=1 Tax=Flectobacillus longus TaxID=2984207 RepID=UPI0024B7A59C|nr:DUF2490 domain-containing protein [Flectobacillus longus]MDI9879207.1 DUF2490 domain-containing protein [Flectobacillus longus]